MVTNERRLLRVNLRNRAAYRIHVDIVLWISLLVCGGMLVWLSIARYQGYNAGMLDLGNMTQAIASVQRGQPLLFTYHDGPTSRLAFHVEWIYFLLALPYMLWPDPRLLLGIQAALFALGALPVYWLTRRHTQSMFAARCLALAYLLYPTAQTSVLFDLHGDTLAMPLLLFTLDALDQRHWRRYALFAILALSCKFYVALPVAVLGMLIWWQYGERRIGLLTTGAALAYGMLAFLVIRPLFTTTATSSVHRGFNYLSFYFGQWQEILLTWDQRLLSAIIVFGPMLLLIRRGWLWLLPGLPVAAATLLSTGPGGAYDYRYHHYATVVPFILMAAIVGARLAAKSSIQPTESPQKRRRLPAFPVWFLALTTLLIVILFNSTLVDTPLNRSFWSGQPGYGLDSASYGVTERDALKTRFLAEAVVPDEPLAASVFLAPHLANRETLYVVRYPDDPGGERLPGILPRVDYVLADSLFDYRLVANDRVVGGITYEIREISQLLNEPSFGLVTARDGLLLFQRHAPPETILEQQVDVISTGSVPSPQAEFGDAIGLLEARIEPSGGRRFHAMFEWVYQGTAPLDKRYVAISHLAGVPGARIVHLPTYALLPTTEWQPGQHIRETFEIELPADLPAGEYTWRVGWYDTTHSEAYATDERSRMDGSREVVVGTITVR